MTELLRRHFTESSLSANDIPVTREAVDETMEAIHAFEEDGDVGVKHFWPKSTQELWKMLDFPEGRPVLWNTYRRNDSARTAWDEGENEKTREEYITGSERMRDEPIRLFAHQLHAVAATVDMMFSEKRKNDKGGMLIADGVGLGKSATLFAIIAFLGQVREWQRSQEESAASDMVPSTPNPSGDDSSTLNVPKPIPTLFRDGECFISQSKFGAIAHMQPPCPWAPFLPTRMGHRPWAPLVPRVSFIPDHLLMLLHHFRSAHENVHGRWSGS